MANADDPGSPGSSPPGFATARPGRGLRAFFRRLRKGVGEAAHLSAPQADAAASRLIDQATAFQSLTVEDVMTPRADIVAVELSCPFGELVSRFVEAEHSRMPVFRETLDDPVGVVHVKDVFHLLATSAERPTDEQAILHKVRRDALYVPGSMRAADLMLRMQTSRLHMALVIDEFGGTDGLVTLEDLVESVVGEIEDEHDDAAVATILPRAGGVFEVDARAALEDLEAAVGHELVPSELDEEIETVGGLVTALAGRVPQRGEVIPHPRGYELQVLDADPRRVKRVRLSPATPAGPPPDTVSA